MGTFGRIKKTSPIFLLQMLSERETSSNAVTEMDFAKLMERYWKHADGREVAGWLEFRLSPTQEPVSAFLQR